MYCKKCGKFIGTDSDLCDECTAKANEVFSEFSDDKGESAPPKTEPPKTEPPKTNVNYNNPNPPVNTEISLGKAIAGVVLGFLGFFITYIGIIVLAEIAALGSSDLGTGFITMFLGCAPSIIALSFGISSIKLFKATSNVKSGKRIPLLILGISSVVFGGIGLFFVFLLLILIMALL